MMHHLLGTAWGWVSGWPRVAAWVTVCVAAWVDVNPGLFYVAVGVAITLLLLPAHHHRNRV